jgi:hypothetical protein
MDTDQEPVYENTSMMDVIYTPVIKPLSPADDSEVKRIRKFLLVILIICLVSVYCISCLLLDDDVKTGSRAQSLFSLKSISTFCITYVLQKVITISKSK